MSLRSIGVLAKQRRAPAAVQDASVGGGVTSALTSLEAAIPTDVVALYTAVIAGCQSVLQDTRSSYLAFRVVISQPGSFLYEWLGSPTLSVVVITVTAVTGFLLAAFFAPKLRSPEYGS